MPATPGAQVRTDGASTLFTRPLYIHQGATLRAFNKQEIQGSGDETLLETDMALLLGAIQ